MSRDFDTLNAEAWKAHALALEETIMKIEGRLTMLFAHINMVERSNRDLEMQVRALRDALMHASPEGDMKAIEARFLDAKKDFVKRSAVNYGIQGNGSFLMVLDEMMEHLVTDKVINISDITLS